MWIGSSKQSNDRRSRASLGENRRYAWKEHAYVVPSPTRKGFQWKASAVRRIERLVGRDLAGQPVTIMVPALYSFKPAESVALGWLNEIDAQTAIRQRTMAACKITGWDVFTFHTLHNLDHYFDSTISAVRDTWVNEGRLSTDCVAQTRLRFEQPYDYHRIHARLVENLVLQSSLLDWLTARTGEAPVQYHVVGTGLMSALVWSGALPFTAAVSSLAKIGARWDDALTAIATEELKKSGTPVTEENTGWRRFHKLRQLIEGRQQLSLPVTPQDLPGMLDAPSRPFWYSATASEQPTLIHTVKDVRHALEAMNLRSWAPEIPRPLATGRLRGWLVSAQHPMASTCRWSFSNYLLATPECAILFMDHIAALARVCMTADPLHVPANPPNDVAKTYPAIEDKRHRAVTS